MSCGIVWMIKKDNEGRAPLEYLPRGPQVSSYATVGQCHIWPALGRVACCWNLNRPDQRYVGPAAH